MLKKLAVENSSSRGARTESNVSSVTFPGSDPASNPASQPLSTNYESDAEHVVAAAPPPVNHVTSLPGRQELAIRRFTQYCTDPLQWGVLLFHTVGTGKTLVSMLMALNSIADMTDTTRIVIIAPAGIYEANFMSDFQKLPNWAAQHGRFVNYPIDKLIGDINTKRIPAGIFDNAIVIIDEAHRLLQKNCKDSEQAGADTEFHPAIINIYFNTKVINAKRCIIMTGTPLQSDLSDICKLFNFVSKTTEFTLSKYAPVTVSVSLKKNLFSVAKDLITSPTATKLLTGVVTYGVTKLMPSLIPYGDSAYTLWISSLALASGYLLIKSHVKEKKALSDRDKDFLSNLPFVSGITALAATTAASIRGYDVATDMFGTIGGVTTSRGLTKLLASNTIDGINEAMELLNEPDWDVEMLAKAASPYMSIYDPIVQKELAAGFSRADMEQYINTPTFFAEKAAEPDGGKSGFPVKNMLEHMVEYDTFQLSILEQMYLGDLSDDMKRVLYLNEYEYPSADPSSKYKFIRKYGRMVGNLSKDVYKYFSNVNEEGTEYVINKRTPEVPDYPGTVFSCPKFETVLQKLLAMRKTGRMEKNKTAGEGAAYTESIELVDQPHLCEPGDIYKETEDPVDYDKQYLPLIYSYTELYGTALFASFLKARGYSYILLHSNQSPEALTENIRRGKSMTYPKLIDKEAPLCIILHPKFTEGYDFKHNPAIFVLEPCNTVGDQLQVHGRIFRRYDTPLRRREKTVNEFVCVDPDENGWWSSANKKLNAATQKIQRTQLLLTPAAVFELFRLYKFVSPDIWSAKRLKKESVKLLIFENTVYGGTAGDIAGAHYCLAHTAHPIADCDPLDGRGCQPKESDTVLTNAERQAQRSNVNVEEVPSPESHTWVHTEQKLSASGLNTQKGGRRTRRRRVRRRGTRKQ